VDPGLLEDPLDPRAVDALFQDKGPDAVRKQVLTARTLRRVRREFFGGAPVAAELYEAFRQGFLGTFDVVKERAVEIAGLIGGRMAEAPRLVIGTRGYRRAMARADLDDIMARVEGDPEEVLAALWASG